MSEGVELLLALAGSRPWLSFSSSKTTLYYAAVLLISPRLSGYEVHEAENGEAAVRLLATMQFGVVISDLNLPGKLNGIDILAALKTITGKIRAIRITGRGSRRD